MGCGVEGLQATQIWPKSGGGQGHPGLPGRDAPWFSASLLAVASEPPSRVPRYGGQGEASGQGRRMRPVASLRPQAPGDDRARGQDPRKARSWGVLRVAAGRDRRSWRILRSRLDSNWPIDPDGAMENPRPHLPGFPQPLGRREQMRRPQAQQALLLVSLYGKTEVRCR